MHMLLQVVKEYVFRLIHSGPDQEPEFSTNSINITDKHFIILPPKVQVVQFVICERRCPFPP